MKKCSIPDIPFSQNSNQKEPIDEKGEVYISNVEYLKMKNIELNKSDIINIGDVHSFIETQKYLELIVENSCSIQKGESIIITPNGILNSKKKRRNNSNEVFFGYFSDLSAYYDIDYELPPNPLIKNNNFENNISSRDDKNEGIFFLIYYNFKFQNYFIKDYENGYGTFIKINNSYKLKDNSLINIGDSFLIFTFSNENTKNQNQNETLCLKAYSGNTTYEPKIFEQTLNKEYTIGRNEKDDVVLQDKMLSRIHCIVFYDEKGWFIKDGNQFGEPSTNGTWIFAYDEFEIYDDMIFKSNANLFSCHLRNNNNKNEI